MRTYKWVLLTAFALLAACAGKKELDTAAEKLMQAYAASDYDAFKALVHPEIAEQINAEKFRYAAKTINQLGTPKDRSMSGISVKSGGPSEGTYTLKFDQGEVAFKLSVLKGTIVSFNLEGDVLTRAMRKTATEEFKISAFTFLSKPGGEPKVGSTFTQGEKIAFRMQVLGLTEAEEHVHLRLTLAVLTTEGKVAFEQVLIDERSKLEEGALPIANPTGSLDAGTPGSYRLRFTIDDVLGNKSQVVDQDISVTAS